MLPQQFIKNGTAPICSACRFFMNAKSRVEVGICTKFGEKNLISGVVKHDFAAAIRGTANLCGPKGQYYESRISALVRK